MELSSSLQSDSQSLIPFSDHHQIKDQPGEPEPESVADQVALAVNGDDGEEEEEKAANFDLEKLLIATTTTIGMETLPAPINHHALDRIIEEGNFRKLISEQQVDQWKSSTTSNGTSTIVDFDDKRTTAVMRASTTSATPNCDNSSCDESRDPFVDSAEVETQISLSEESEKFRKPKEDDDYYDTVTNEPINYPKFSRYSTLKKKPRTFMIPSTSRKPFQTMNNARLDVNIEDKLVKFVRGKNHQSDPTVKSIVSNDDRKVQRNFADNVENQKMKEKYKRILRDSAIYDSLKEFNIFQSSNYPYFLQKGLSTKKEANANQRVFPVLKVKNGSDNDTAKFSVKSFKLRRRKPSKYHSYIEQLNKIVWAKNSRRNDSFRIQDSRLKANAEQRNDLVQQFPAKILNLPRRKIVQRTSKCIDPVDYFQRQKQTFRHKNIWLSNYPAPRYSVNGTTFGSSLSRSQSRE